MKDQFEKIKVTDIKKGDVILIDHILTDKMVERTVMKKEVVNRSLKRTLEDQKLFISFDISDGRRIYFELKSETPEIYKKKKEGVGTQLKLL